MSTVDKAHLVFLPLFEVYEWQPRWLLSPSCILCGSGETVRKLFARVQTACYLDNFRKLFRQLTLAFQNEQISSFGSGYCCRCFGSLR
jgi:hypothetical protein